MRTSISRSRSVLRTTVRFVAAKAFAFAAATRKEDGAGALVDADAEGVVELDPVEKLIAGDGERKPGEMVPVRLEAHVTEVGTLELWCVARDGNGRWKLEYSVRERE